MKLDLGGGAGYKTLDRHGFTSVDLVGAHVVWDLRKIPYPFEDNTVEVVHCSHTLEHLYKNEAIELIRESKRMLIPGGVLTLSVPDMDIYIHSHLTGDWSMHPEGLQLIKDLNYCGGSSDPVDDAWKHKYLWCWESLAYVLEKEGFVDIVRHQHDDSPHKHLFPEAYNVDMATSSLYVDAVKPLE